MNDKILYTTLSDEEKLECNMWYFKRFGRAATYAELENWHRTTHTQDYRTRTGGRR